MKPRRLSLEKLEVRNLLATYYVDGDSGSDTQRVGSFEQPFATINRAALFASPGDTVYIREGVYREQVEVLRSGTEAEPIVFEAYNGEEVLVSTTEPLVGWTQHSGNIYKTSFSSSVRGRNSMSLFVEGQLMHEAHWSDQGPSVNLLDKNEWATISSATTTTIRDSSLAGLPNDYWNGGFVYAQTAYWSLETRRILDFDGATGTFTVDSPFFYNPNQGTKYLIFDHLAALDAPGEWYFDQAANTLYFWAPGGGDPDNYDVEVKIRKEGFDLNGHDHIQIKGINFLGGDLAMNGSSHILLEGAHVVAPDRGFGPEGTAGDRALDLSGDYNIIRDSEFEQIWLYTFNVIGKGNQIVNNYIHHTGYANTNYGAVRLDIAAEDTLISHNTITEVGRGAIGGFGGVRSLIQYNDISEVGRISDDLAAIYFANSSLGNAIIHHNVIHDISNTGAWTIYFDHYSSDVAVHHNITYNTSRGGNIYIPPSHVLWFNNTHFNNGNITSYLWPATIDAAPGTRFYNNIISSFATPFSSISDPVDISNNYFTSSASNFVNAAAGDFRLVGSSGAIDLGREIPGVTDGFSGVAPDAGALELGQPMWEYGHNFADPPTPPYDWQPVAYSNRVLNSGFEADLSGWTVTAGDPETYLGNAWYYHRDGLALFGNYSLELQPGDRVEQTIDGLVPNTTYKVSAQTRFARDLQLEEYDAAFGSFTTGTHRTETYIGDIDYGEWLRFDDVDFGDNVPLYDTIELGANNNSSLLVAFWLDAPNSGQLIGTVNVPAHDFLWYMSRDDITSVTGVHDLYVQFLGSGGASGKFDRLRLLNSGIQDSITLGVSDYNATGSTTSIKIGGVDWKTPSDSFSFVTGPNSSSATIYIENSGASFAGYVDFVALTGDNYQQAQPVGLELIVDPTNGAAVLLNSADEPISFNGYVISDTAASLLPTAWISLTDQKYNGQVWHESDVTGHRLGESTDGNQVTLAAGQLIYLGEVSNALESAELRFEYQTPDGTAPTAGVVRFQDSGIPALPGDYNRDSTVGLADYTIWRNALGSTTASFSLADGNGDGVTDASDYQVWKRQFGKSLSTAFLDTAYATPLHTAPVVNRVVEDVSPKTHILDGVFGAVGLDSVYSAKTAAIRRTSNLVATKQITLAKLETLQTAGYSQSTSDSEYTRTPASPPDRDTVELSSHTSTAPRGAWEDSVDSLFSLGVLAPEVLRELQ
ncbi:carbohydrate-binding protein [Aeoliella sp. ICT_H6.2]|uniref:Carbohydrate-binding protein n=1 Tax=Aeoliella straminimaris TaxID=2954799 RepID=A0A9X2JGQ5_9BACT|nr:carbohydrate-binding protein [Aeoliella straminimaris]MCO6044652.1 carbohydrate-binding protein [Aeoliella straminimaris]